MTRDEALKQLEEFVPRMIDYAEDRNRVVAGHTNVSRLSPAIRHRLISEDEVTSVALENYSFSKVEKFVQEVYWRSYWKSWLEMRPEVWSAYQRDLAEMNSGARRAAEKVLSGQSEIEIFDYFASELITTGYLHNHARMWFAAIWVHEFKLPWQLGADLFPQHLLDGDPASNTLSWRWVAGLHTAGKNYLARASNLEQYLAPEILNSHLGGLERLSHPKAAFPPTHESAPSPNPVAEVESGDSLFDAASAGLWLHEDDLKPEPELLERSVRVAVITSLDLHQTHGYASMRREWIMEAAKSTADRIGPKAEMIVSNDTALALADWAESHGLNTVITYQPWVGPVRDKLPELKERLRNRGIALRLVRKPSDQVWVSLATAGFFGFWKKLLKKHPLLREMRETA